MNDIAAHSLVHPQQASESHKEQYRKNQAETSSDLSGLCCSITNRLQSCSSTELSPLQVRVVYQETGQLVQQVARYLTA